MGRNIENKRLLILLLIFQISFSVFGQISGHVEYNYSVLHSIDYTTKSVLKFESNKSFFTTFRKDIKNDSLKLIANEGNSKNYLVNKDSRKKPIYFIDKKNNILITKIWKFYEDYILTESIPNINWEIKSEHKKLSNLDCQKAVGYFRGRTYTVWFTEAIPVSFGPWKLQGLPGLILEAKDDTETFFYRATKIKLNTNEIIEVPNIDDAIDLKTFVSVIEPEKLEEMTKRSQAKLDRSITVSSSSGIDRSSLKETTYEWEEKENKDD